MTRAQARHCAVGGCVESVVERRIDGTVLMRSPEPLASYPERVTDSLEHWAQTAPERTFVARRDRQGSWLRITYAQMLMRARRIAGALRDRGLDAQRPVAIMAENSLEHLTLGFGAMLAGVPYAPISPQYALASKDYGKLRHILETLTPGLIFASGPAYADAIRTTVAGSIEVVLAEGELPDRAVTPFTSLLESAEVDLDDVHRRIGADTIAKFLFTSGSTKMPKGVINTHRMLCANQQMIRQCLRFLGESPPVLVDWLPWNHTFGGNHNVGIALYNGGCLYIDDGKPTPQGIDETLRNLREIAPTVYFNVPKGFEEIAAAMEMDDALRTTLFSKVKAFFFAGAGLSQAVWNQLDQLGQRTVGERICMLTGLGMTETAPSAMFALGPHVESGHIGLPLPGVELKLARVDDKTEVRFRGPNVMPGYWRDEANTAQAFDDEGFYRTGDAARFIDPDQPQKGLMFDGRIAEDFKLSSGTFVNVGALRAKIATLGAPCVQDSVICGPDRDDVGALLFPRIDACCKLAGLRTDTPSADVLRHPAVLAFFQALADRLCGEGSGSANRIVRLWILAEPPSIDFGEITDKGSINQRAVLRRRAPLVDRLYQHTYDDPGKILAHQP